MANELNGAKFKDRQINVKLHVPFSPTGKPIFGSRKGFKQGTKIISNKSTAKANSAFTKYSAAKEEEDNLSFIPDSSNIERIPFTDELKKDNKNEPQGELSHDTIFIGNAIDKTTDKDVRDFFKDYSLTDVFIFRGANQRRMQRSISLRQKTVSVLVTLKNKEDLNRAIDDLNYKKLNGKGVYLRVAQISKIDEVFRAANANPVPDKSPPTTATTDEHTQEQTINTTAETSTLIDLFRETQKKLQSKYKTVEKQTKQSEPIGEDQQTVPVEGTSVS